MVSLGSFENPDSGDWEFSGYEIEDDTDDIEAVLDKIDLEVLDLSNEESDYLIKRLTGFSNTEIGKGINGVSLYKIKRSLKEKFNNYYGSIE